MLNACIVLLVVLRMKYQQKLGTTKGNTMVDAKTKAMLFNEIANEVDQDGWYKQQFAILTSLERFWHEPGMAKYIMNKEEQLKEERLATIRGLVEYEISKMEDN